MTRPFSSLAKDQARGKPTMIKCSVPAKPLHYHFHLSISFLLRRLSSRQGHCYTMATSYEQIRNHQDSEDSSKPFLDGSDVFNERLKCEIARRKRLQYLVIIPWTIIALAVPFVLVTAGILIRDAKDIRIPTTIYCKSEYLLITVSLQHI